MKTARVKLITIALVLTLVFSTMEVNAQTWECGNVDGDPGGTVDLGDLTALIDYLFISHTEPAPMEAADMDGCTGVDVGDLDALLRRNPLLLPPYSSLNCSTIECSIIPTGSITLDHVEGLLQPGVLMTGLPEAHFYLRIINDTSSHIAIANGFQLYSPDGATWGSLTAEILDPGWESTLKIVDANSADGQGADTASFGAASFENGQYPLLPPDFDEVVYKITIGSIGHEHEGKTIVLDTCFFPPAGTWKWGPSEAPTWGGPYYFTIVCCVGLTGNVDGDPEDMVDLGDLTRLIDYLFISFEEPGCLKEANIDGDAGGLVDLGDLTKLIDYLFISFTPPAECQ